MVKKAKAKEKVNAGDLNGRIVIDSKDPVFKRDVRQLAGIENRSLSKFTEIILKATNTTAVSSTERRRKV